MLPFFMIVCLQSMAANFAHPVTPTIIQNLGLGDYMFGLAFAGMAGTSFLFSPFWGKLADYVQSRTILLICNLGYAVGQTFFSFVLALYPLRLWKLPAQMVPSGSL